MSVILSKSIQIVTHDAYKFKIFQWFITNTCLVESVTKTLQNASHKVNHVPQKLQQMNLISSMIIVSIC